MLQLQNDKIKGEFSVYRQSKDANVFMTSGNVMQACKKRLARHAASYRQPYAKTAYLKKAGFEKNGKNSL